MEWNVVYKRTNRAIISMPVFSGEEKTVSRLNDFCSKLEREIEKFCKKEDFPQGGKYFCNCRITSAEDIIFDFRLKSNGKTIKFRSVRYEFCRGFVKNVEIIS